MAEMMSENSDRTPEMVIRSHFQKYDKNGNGTLELEEVREISYDLGYYLSDDEIRLLMASVDKQGDGHISFEEFCKAWKKTGKEQYMNHIESDAGRQAIQYYRYFDADNTGTLSISEFNGLWNDLKRYNLVPQDTTAETALETLDNDDDGCVRFNEYVEYFMKTFS
eukprot:TRINITY_DN282_c0_g1_i1.p1 TRINITY_DN282_c0_g1~~TRINITY_DN282_c0_g1_i1.p1  ORF type:complete len:166 (+),score=40.73 TRINITY_DN282_c0_g1_i1:244-741(+)